MERHKLWDDRAGKLMERTFEKFGYGKKKDIKENLEVQETPTVEENSLLDQDDYSMLEKAIEGPVEKLLADGYTKEDLVDAFKASLGMDQSEIDSGGVSQEVYTMVDKLKSHVGIVDMDEDAREYISDELLLILDKMDKNSMNEEDFNTTTQLSKDMDKATASADKRMGRVASRISTIAKLQDVLVSYTRDLMKDAEKVGEKELTLVLRKMLKNVGQLVSSGEGAQNENETENPEVDRAEDAARKAKIKALQVQLKALQKTQSME